MSLLTTTLKRNSGLPHTRLALRVFTVQEFLGNATLFYSSDVAIPAQASLAEERVQEGMPDPSQMALLVMWSCQVMERMRYKHHGRKTLRRFS